jgi:hypothetical protein
MMRFQVGVLCLVLIWSCGCDNGNAARLEQQKAAADLELQAKCSKASKQWFDENAAGLGNDRNQTIDFSNHYNKNLNKCFVLLEYRLNMETHRDGAGLKSEQIQRRLFDVYENNQIGELSKMHAEGEGKLQSTPPTDTVGSCSVRDAKCASEADFEKSIKPYMND